MREYYITMKDLLASDDDIRCIELQKIHSEEPIDEECVSVVIASIEEAAMWFAEMVAVFKSQNRDRGQLK